MLVAVVENDARDARAVMSYIEAFSKETGVDLCATHFSNAPQFLQADASQFSLAFLDIDMPGLNGMELARLLREDDPGIVIVFVTNMPQYALSAYEVEAADYLVKPVSYADFSLKLRKALRYVELNREHRLVLREPGGVASISVWEVLYVESSRHYLVYHTLDGEHRVRGTMASLEGELAPLQFARCNSGYLVNLRHVRAIEGDDVLVGSERLRVSRSRRAGFLDAFTRYVGGIGMGE